MVLKREHLGNEIRNTLRVSNVVLEKDGEDRCADHVKHEEVLQSQGGKEYSTYNETEEG